MTMERIAFEPYCRTLLLLPVLTATLPGWQILPFPAAPGVVLGEVEFGMGCEQGCPGLQ